MQAYQKYTYLLDESAIRRPGDVDYDWHKHQYQGVKELICITDFVQLMMFPTRFLMAILIPPGFVLCAFLSLILLSAFGIGDYGDWFFSIFPKNLIGWMFDIYPYFFIWAFFGRWIYLAVGWSKIGHVIFETCFWIMIAVVVIIMMMTAVFSAFAAIMVFVQLVGKFFEWISE